MSVRLVRVDAAGLGPYAARLRALELEVKYPLDDGRDFFRIDHGPAYHPFFSGLGDAHFLVALDGEQVVGSFCGVAREARVGERRIRSMYLCDFKLAKSYRGAKVGLRMAWRAMAAMAVEPRVRRWRVCTFTSMRGERGDVGRSLRGFHAGRLLRREATLALYFAHPAALARLDLSHAPQPAGGAGLDLSPNAAVSADVHGLCSTVGRKDFTRGDGSPFVLAHVPTSPAHPGWAARLKSGGEAMSAGALGCFAVDERLTEHVRWLEGQKLRPGARAGVYALRAPGGPGALPWVHQATSEI